MKIMNGPKMLMITLHDEPHQTMDLDTTKIIKATETLVVDGSALALRDVAKVAGGKLDVSISTSRDLEVRLAAAVEVVDRAIENGDTIYGVTTGFGGMADQRIPCEFAAGLQKNLLEFLATGAGEPLCSTHVRGAMLLRANVLLQGYSGIRFDVIERLIQFLQSNLTPVVRSHGSIGASGDLVPLAAIGRAITGQSNYVHVDTQDGIVDSTTALARLGLSPLELRPKEGLALVNGTSFSAAIAANATFQAKKLMVFTVGTQSLMLRALLAHGEPFEAFVHYRKPHLGQIWVARVMRQLLRIDGSDEQQSVENKAAIQDRYAVRCSPQFLGPIVEGFAHVQQVVETEMNAVSDNPLVDVDSERFYQSGNFLGQQLSMAMDDLRRHVGLLAKHLDIQIASLVTSEISGLPPSLRGNDEVPYNMGLKGLQICGNSIMPMLTFHGNSLNDHFPTHAEQFNQNINGLSFGSANLAWRSVELFRQYLAIAMIFAVQSLDLRARQLYGHFDGRSLLGESARPIYDGILESLEVECGASRPFLFNDADRWLERDVDRLAKQLADEGPVFQAMQSTLVAFEREFALNP